MKLVTRDADYAMRALVFIAKSKARIVPVSTLVRELRIPKPFLRKILQILHKEGILKASKGYGGGFELALSPSEMSLGDLLKVFQGPLKLNQCILKKRLCPDRNVCPLKKKIDGIEKYVASKLESVTIASLLKKRD